ncbi:MAG TPA: hypothetical protein VFI31_20475 [Pirellulales bacterium]|nr:hypothetical protein [Pirellulales bacterium]
MSSNDLERVRADLSTMRSALGIGLPWSVADVWFCLAIAATAGVYALLSWPNSAWEITSSWAAAPLAAALGPYVIYIAAKSRSLPPRDEPRRREYKSALVAMAFVIPAAVGYAKWGQYVGMTTSQMVGCVLFLMGAAFFVIGVAAPPIRYPRSYFIAPAIPLMLFGLLIPVTPADYRHSLIGLMGLVAMALAAFITHRHVRRQAVEGSSDGGH